MKRINIIMAVMAMLMLTACDKDHEIAYYLDGYWEGTIRDSHDTYLVFMEFVQSNGFSRSGIGYEKDCTWDRHQHKSSVRFRWTVRDQYIYLNYDDGTSYVMDCIKFPRWDTIGEHFYGYLINEQTKENVADFDLHKSLNHDDRVNETDSVVVIDNKPNVELKESELK